MKAISCQEVPLLTIISPALDEEPVISSLYQQIIDAVEPINVPFEIIFIDDGSRDGTYDEMRKLHEQDTRVRVIHFHKNQGKSAALSAGFHHAKGEVIVTMDADLQDDPHEIPNMLMKLDEGYDLVSGWKKKRYDSRFKVLTSKIFNFLVSQSSHIPLHDINCGLKCYRREVIEQLHLYGKMHRFIPVIANWYGFRIAEIPVKHHPRTTGRSKYGWGRIPRGFFDFCTVWFLTIFRERPSHFFNTIGLISLVFTFVFFMLGMSSVWYSSLLSSLIFFFLCIGTGLIGGHLILVGILTEYIVYFFSRYEPSYYINEMLDHEDTLE